MDRSAVRSLLWPGYAVAILLIVFPLGDLLANIWPARLGSVEWRFGVVGLLSGFVLTPLLGIVALVVVAAALDHGPVLRVVGAIELAVAAGTVPVLVLFILDWIQMRSAAQPEVQRSMDIGSLKAIVKHVFTVVTLGWLGLTAWKVGRPGRRGGRARAGSPLVRTPGSESTPP